MLAVYFLANDKKNWWDFLTTTLGDIRFEWDTFQQAFHAEYFPRTCKESLRHEFLTLPQNGRLVAQYTIDFQRLAKMFLEMVPIEVAQSKHYIRGLDPAI